MPGLKTIPTLTGTSKVFATLLCALCVGLSALTVEAQSRGRMPWPRNASDNIPAQDQAVEPAPITEPETVSQVPQAAAQAGILDILERQKTGIVGSWVGTVSGGNKLIATFNSDGTAHNSVQGEVSTIPELGVLTPLHGVWTHLGGRQFGATFMGVLYDINTGQLNGFLKVRVLLTINVAGDEISGTDKVQILDPDGNVVDTFPSSNTPYVRIKFEPFN
jgi:hypothetical protein